jgi:putative membrane protein
MGDGGGMWFGGGFMWIFWILLIVIVIWVINNTTRGTKKEDSPLDILKKRYARGEIDEQEYESRRKELEK